MSSLLTHVMLMQRQFIDNLVSYDPDAQALFDRMTGVAPSIDLKNKINNFIITGKSENIYQGFDCLYVPKGMQDYTSGVLDWKRPISAATYGGVNWNSTDGFRSSDSYFSNTHVKTYYQPNGSGNYQLDSCSIGVYVIDGTLPSGQYGTYFGSYGGSGVKDTFLANNGNTEYNACIHGNGNFTIPIPLSTGLIILSRIDHTTWEIYQNGVLVGTYTSTAINLPPNPFYLFAANPGGGSVYDMARGLAIGAFFAGGYINPSDHIALKNQFDLLWS